jgi:alpha-L-rhamnosidase
VPSFGYWIEQGSTTLWEGWDGNPKLSRNHPMWGGAMTWFYRFLAGVKPLQAGFRTFEVAPMVPQGLDYIHYRFDTVYVLND